MVHRSRDDLHEQWWRIYNKTIMRGIDLNLSLPIITYGLMSVQKVILSEYQSKHPFDIEVMFWWQITNRSPASNNMRKAIAFTHVVIYGYTGLRITASSVIIQSTRQLLSQVFIYSMYHSFRICYISIIVLKYNSKYNTTASAGVC